MRIPEVAKISRVEDHGGRKFIMRMALFCRVNKGFKEVLHTLPQDSMPYLIWDSMKVSYIVLRECGGKKCLTLVK